MPKYKDKSAFSYPADLVWAAACAAYRVNNGYVKNTVYNNDGSTELDQHIAKIQVYSNRDLAKQYLADSSHKAITHSDFELGRKCRRDLVNSVTMAALKNQITEWGLATARVAELETVTSSHDLALITAMPKSHAQQLVRESVDSRLARCDSGDIYTVGSKVNLTAEVVRSTYSAQYHSWYITAITTDNRSVFFAYRESVALGKLIQFRGTVKRHADRGTQLNRVKITQQEAV